MNDTSQVVLVVGIFYLICIAGWDIAHNWWRPRLDAILKAEAEEARLEALDWDRIRRMTVQWSAVGGAIMKMQRASVQATAAMEQLARTMREVGYAADTSETEDQD